MVDIFLTKEQAEWLVANGDENGELISLREDLEADLGWGTWDNAWTHGLYPNEVQPLYELIKDNPDFDGITDKLFKYMHENL